MRTPPSPAAIQHFYEWLGRKHDWAEVYESRAKKRALALLDIQPGMRVLNVGVGTGKDHRRLVQAVAPGGIAVGVDIAATMLRLTQRRTGAPVVQADARALPFADNTFDRLFCAYMFDLLPLPDLRPTLLECVRVVRPGGRLVLVSLGEGVTRTSQFVMRLWKGLYQLAPLACGGCRPIPLAHIATTLPAVRVQHETIVQWGVPSEMVVIDIESDE